MVLLRRIVPAAIALKPGHQPVNALDLPGKVATDAPRQGHRRVGPPLVADLPQLRVHSLLN